MLTYGLPRTVATAAFVTSVGVHLGVIPYSWVAFAPYFVMRIPPQLWRLATSFLITGSGLSVLMDTYFCRSSDLGRY